MNKKNLSRFFPTSPPLSAVYVLHPSCPSSLSPSLCVLSFPRPHELLLFSHRFSSCLNAITHTLSLPSLEPLRTPCQKSESLTSFLLSTSVRPSTFLHFPLFHPSSILSAPLLRSRPRLFSLSSLSPLISIHAAFDLP